MFSRFMILYQCKSYSGGFSVSEWSLTDQSALQYLVVYLYINIYFIYTFIYRYKQNQSPISHPHALNFNQFLQGNWRLDRFCALIFRAIPLFKNPLFPALQFE